METDVSEPSAGNIFIGHEGRYYADDQAALDRINEIRYEACTAGDVPDPRDSSRMLTEDDYVPIKWSTDLERVARIRASEGALTGGHSRLNGQSIWNVSYNGVSSFAEVLAWNGSRTMVSGINQWYGEKADWVNQTSGAVTGHYTSMINPNNKYVGLGDFYSYTGPYYNTVSGEFNPYASGLDETMLEPTGDVIQKIEIGANSNYIKGYTFHDNCEIEAEESIDTALIANLTFGSYSTSMPVLAGATFESSDVDVAEVSSDGTVTAIAPGEAVISAIIGGQSVSSFTVTVPAGAAGPTIVDSGSCGDNVVWTLNSDGLLTISGTGTMTDFDIYPPWYSYKDSIISVVVGSGITSIGERAFYECGNLISIEFPKSINCISTSAFFGCNSLSDIYYSGVRIEWSNINIGQENDALSQAVLHCQTEACLGHTLTLDESISLNYYFDIPEAMLEDDGAKLVFSQNGVPVSEILLEDAVLTEKDGITGYMFSLPLVTKEMADTISAVIIDSGGNESEPYVYSAKQYCEELIQQSADDAELVALVKALMNYGASAQEHFGYNTENLVNASLSTEDKVISDISDGAISDYLTSYEMTNPADISYYGATLDLLSALNMKLYFQLPEGRSISDYSFTITDNGDNPVALDTGVGLYGPYARISNIYSVDIDAEYIVKVFYDGNQIGWVKTSPFAYTDSYMAGSSVTNEMRTLLCAMYHYNACAKEYFNNN